MSGIHNCGVQLRDVNHPSMSSTLAKMLTLDCVRDNLNVKCNDIMLQFREQIWCVVEL